MIRNLGRLKYASGEQGKGKIAPCEAPELKSQKVKCKQLKRLDAELLNVAAISQRSELPGASTRAESGERGTTSCQLHTTWCHGAEKGGARSSPFEAESDPIAPTACGRCQRAAVSDVQWYACCQVQSDSETNVPGLSKTLAPGPALGERQTAAGARC